MKGKEKENSLDTRDTRPTKLYCIRKYIAAASATEALNIEKNFKADDCWLEDTWKQERVRIGFKTND